MDIVFRVIAAVFVVAGVYQFINVLRYLFRVRTMTSSCEWVLTLRSDDVIPPEYLLRDILYDAERSKIRVNRVVVLPTGLTPSDYQTCRKMAERYALLQTRENVSRETFDETKEPES